MDRRFTGFTLLDLLAALAIVAVVSAIAAPIYSDFVDNANDAAAQSDILEIQMRIEQFYGNGFAYPDDLNEVPGVPAEDPWGRAYSYLRIDGSTVPGIKGKQRKDKNLNPLNTDYDLFSSGKDGKTKGPLTAKDSHDDIIRAGNGGFVGRGENH